MSGFRLTVTAALGAAALLAAMICVPAAALADSISIVSAGPDGSGNPYDLTIVANDGNGLVIQSMTAHVYSASDQDVANVTMQAQSVSDPTNQTWAAASPITEAALPAGTYTVTVDAADADETDTGLTAPGSFSVSYTSSDLIVTPEPPTVTQGSQAVTFSGTLTGTAPGGTPVGIANAPVDLSVSGGAASQVATTDSNGDFSYPATGITQSADYNFTVAATGSYPAASDDVTVDAQQAATSITVSPDPATVTEGIQTVVFTGSVTVTPPLPAIQTPVSIGSGVPVYLNGSASPVATTDSNGDFSYTADNVSQAGTYSFSVASTSLYTGASADAAVGTLMAPTVMTVTPSPSFVTFGSEDVTFNGTVTATPAGGAPTGIGPGVPVYLSVGGSTPTQVTSTTDAAGDFTYTATGIAQTGSYDFSVDGAPLYEGASYAVPVNLDPGTTTITASANPTDINLASSTVTFSGTVSVTPFGSTTAVGVGSGVPVYLSVGGGTATQVATTTDASGDFSYTASGITQAADYDFSVHSGTFYSAASDSVPIGQNQVQSTLLVTPDPVSVTEGSQSVTFTGQLTGVSPGGTTAVDIQDAPVDVSIGGAPATQIKTTDSNGDFSYTVTGLSQNTAYAFSVGSSGTYTAATDDVTVAVNQAQTQITGIAVTPTHLKYGQTATLTGTVQYLSGTTWTALPDTAVHLTETGTSLGSATTGSDGTFTASLPSTHGPGWSATVDSANLIQQTSATGNLSIAVPMKVKSFSASLGVNDKVTSTGCLEVTAPVGYGPQTSVGIQYAASKNGPWKSLGKLPLHNQAGKYKSCPSADESYFSGALAARLASAYYRADFAATDSFQSAVSKVIHAWKYQTRFVSFSVSPHSVSKGSTVTIKGRLEVKDKSWRGWAGQKVNFVYNDKGTSFWGSLGTASTSSTGWATIKAEGGPGRFVAVTYAAYAGNSTHLATESNGIDVSNNNGSSTGKSAALNLSELPVLPVPLLPELTLAVPSIADLARR